MEENRYQKLVRAIEEERKAEELFYLKMSQKTSKVEKAEAGILLYPLSLEKSIYTIGERIELSFVRTKNLNQNHRFKVGVAASLTIEGREEYYSCTISFVRRNIFKVILSSQNFTIGNFPSNAWYNLELTYDEKPYRVMRDAMRKVFETKSLAVQEIRDGILKKESFHYGYDHHAQYEHPRLNKAQTNAINQLVNVSRVGIIHGPPGTGKTTTITHLVKALLKNEKRILLCAPSNNAVDLLAHRLDLEEVNVLRIGNVTRIDDHVGHLTLDEKTRSHPEWNRIKKVKIEAEEAKKLAGTYKRKFGSDERSYRSEMYKEAKELKAWAHELEDRIVDEIVFGSNVIASTLIGIENRYVSDLEFDTIIIDEASQALEPECWNAIIRGKRVILVGDHMQLPPTVKSKRAVELGLETTLLDQLASSVKHSFFLDVQYRMNDNILEFSNDKFYESKLRSDSSVSSWTLPNDNEPVVLIDTSGCGFEEAFNYKNRSISNEGEYFILREYFLDQMEKILGAEIGIISPYAEQVRFIRSQISEDEAFQNLDLQIDTIDGFQGQEKDLIIISLVRSNINSEIGFLKDFRRLNVALTRARKKLVVIGDFSTLSSNELYSDFIKFVDQKGQYKSAWEYMSY